MHRENEQLLIWFEQISLYNDEQAFAQLFRCEFSRLYRFALQYVEVAEAAEEIVNDIFVKLWRYRSHLHTIKNPESYLFIGVKNQSLNYIKQYSRYKVSSADGLLQQLASRETPEQNMEWKELQSRMNEAVDQLPDQCRTIFKLVKEEGVKPRQVAKILNLSVRTVETQIYRAMKRLHLVLVEVRKGERS